MVHDLNLADEPFEAIRSGRKVIESRLYDAKRQKIALGDTLVFTNRNHASQRLEAEVVGLLHYSTFAELFASNDPAKFGGKDEQFLLNQIHQFYTAEDEAKYGVLGIQIRLVNS